MAYLYNLSYFPVQVNECNIRESVCASARTPAYGMNTLI